MSERGRSRALFDRLTLENPAAIPQAVSVRSRRRTLALVRINLAKGVGGLMLFFYENEPGRQTVRE